MASSEAVHARGLWPSLMPAVHSEVHRRYETTGTTKATTGNRRAKTAMMTSPTNPWATATVYRQPVQFKPPMRIMNVNGTWMTIPTTVATSPNIRRRDSFASLGRPMAMPPFRDPMVPPTCTMGNGLEALIPAIRGRRLPPRWQARRRPQMAAPEASVVPLVLPSGR